jgi:hypothetical protein
MNIQTLSDRAQTLSAPTPEAPDRAARVYPGCFADYESRRRFDRLWSDLCVLPLTPAMMLVHAIATGRSPARAFTPISNPTKLANGQKPWQSLEAALYTLRFAVRQHEAKRPVDVPYGGMFAYLDMVAFSRSLAAIKIESVAFTYRSIRGVQDAD